MNLTVRIIFIVVLLIIESALADSGKPIQIGILASLSDEWAALGENMVKGAEIARDEINAAGGIAGSIIELVIEDTQEAKSGVGAVTAYRNLRRRGINYFIGPSGTPAALSLAPLAAKEPVLLITPMAGIAEFSRTAKNLFNSRGVDDAASRSMARYALERGWKRAAILSSQQPWESAQGHAFRDEFMAAGGEVIGFEEPLPDATDFKVLLGRFLASRPAVVFFSNSNRVAVAARQLRDQGYNGPKLAALLDDSIVQAANGALEDCLFYTFGGGSTEFTAKFEQRFDSKPNLGADTSYDALRALSLALSGSPHGEPLKVAQKLAGVTFTGASGAFRFDRDRIARRTLKLYKVIDGSIKATN